MMPTHQIDTRLLTTRTVTEGIPPFTWISIMESMY